ncbi:MAG: RNA polymerase sigma factor [Hyphomicrobiales bacterium]|nr:MAG: RNA polymerase sigma factor [Hyphomicrobiales bacterium]
MQLGSDRCCEPFATMLGRHKGGCDQKPVLILSTGSRKAFLWHLFIRRYDGPEVFMVLNRNQVIGDARSDDWAPRDAASTRVDNSFIERLYNRYFGQLVNGIRATYGDGPPDPDEVAQQAFAKLASRPSIDDIADAESYVWIAARNIMLSEKRAMRVRSEHFEQAKKGVFGATCDNFDPERVFIAKDNLDLVIRMLKEMPARRRQIFLLVRVDGLTPEQAGRAMGVSRTSAVRHIALATAAIAEAFSDERNLMGAVSGAI